MAAPQTIGALFDLNRYLKERVAIIERELDGIVARSDDPASRLFEAMCYSLLAGGKRLRPILALASCEAVGGRIELAMGLACGIEMIHTYSMIHDDLPCMDDDDLRRGRPTNHKVYGEAMATLAGDALLTDAFGVVAALSARAGVNPAAIMEAIEELAQAAGSGGMVAGQVLDLEGEGKATDPKRLEYLHGKKTGALFLAAVRGGAILGGADEAKLAALTDYAGALGLAYQVIDDLLDVESSTEQMGKRTQKDQAHGKATYPALLGVAKSHELAHELERRAHRALASFDERAEPLRRIATFVVERKL
jgi:geranylgeranyl diphosphate synthase, type II